MRESGVNCEIDEDVVFPPVCLNSLTTPFERLVCVMRFLTPVIASVLILLVAVFVCIIEKVWVGLDICNEPPLKSQTPVNCCGLAAVPAAKTASPLPDPYNVSAFCLVKKSVAAIVLVNVLVGLLVLNEFVPVKALLPPSWTSPADPV